jgi:hypothetical protein
VRVMVGFAVAVLYGLPSSAKLTGHELSAEIP